MNYVKLWKVGAKLHREICAKVEKDFEVLKSGRACIQITSYFTNLKSFKHRSIVRWSNVNVLTWHVC